MGTICLTDVSKCYHVFNSPFQSLIGLLAPRMVVPKEVWALRDINLVVEPGECIGIIGNNGSGKSTLLGVVGGIISPSAGKVSVEGQVSTLLDLTVGMQMELSGRENVRIISGLLGMSTVEIQRRTPQIIDFAELGEAIERPVKTYSTGMTMRLGFSIALFADFDIFLVDEVLAVGDNNYHRKCLHRMRMLHVEQGKTILIASHGLTEISALTNRLVLLKEGRVLKEGRTEEVLGAYWRECEAERARVGHRVPMLRPVNPYGADLGHVKIVRVRFLDGEEQQRQEYGTGEPLCIEIWFDAKHSVDNPLFRVQFFRNDGVWVHGMNSFRHGCDLGQVEGKGCMQLRYETINLLEGDYFVSVGVWPDEYTSFLTDVAYDFHEKAYVLRVRSERYQGAGIVTQPATWRFYPPGAPETDSLWQGAPEEGDPE